MTEVVTEIFKKANENRNKIITENFNKLVKEIDNEIEYKCKSGSFDLVVNSNIFGLSLGDDKRNELKKMLYDHYRSHGYFVINHASGNANPSHNTNEVLFKISWHSAVDKKPPENPPNMGSAARK